LAVSASWSGGWRGWWSLVERLTASSHSARSDAVAKVPSGPGSRPPVFWQA